MNELAILHSLQDKEVYEVGGQHFEVICRCREPVPVTSDMEAAMAAAAAEENSRGHRSDISDPIPFEVWGESDFVIW